MGLNIKEIWTETYTASEDLSSNQYYGVHLDDDRSVDLQDAVTEKPAGILLNKPESGYAAKVLLIGRTPVVVGEAIAAGALIRIGDDGKAYNWDPGTDTTAYVLGRCVEGADNDGEYAECEICAVNPARGNC
jgi:hypothetical protein